MSEKPQRLVDRLPHRLQRAAIMGSVLLASMALTGEAAQANEHSPVPRGSHESLSVAGNENAPLPVHVRQLLRKNTKYIEGLQGVCTGDAINGGKLLGISTAIHCLPEKSAWVTGADGKKYVILPGPVRAMSGDELGKLKPDAEIDRFLVPEDDGHSDLAVGVARGVSNQRAWHANQASSLSPKEIYKLNNGLGVKIFSSGWPWKQPGREGADKRRQNFAMRVLGTGLTYNSQSTSKKLHVLWAEAPMTKGDKAEAGPGFSGAGWYTYIDGKLKRGGGVAAVYQDHAGPGSSVGFTIEPKHKNYVELNVVQSPEQVPGYTPGL